MEELHVVVQQQPGVITWNFDQLKAALAEGLEKYSMMVYTDATIKDAKADVAMLRKLRTSVEGRRKEIKDKCLEPYAVIEAQAKELTGLIDKPISVIAGQIEAYEKERKAKVRAEILAYIAEATKDLPDGIGKKLESKIYDSRWENATATKKSWQEAIDRAVAATKGDIAVLSDVEQEFQERAFTAYNANLVLSEALAKVSELRKQKEEILKNECRRREAEECKRLEEAQRKAYYAEHAAQAVNTPTQAPSATDMANNPGEEEKTQQTPANGAQMQNTESASTGEDEEHTIIFRVRGTKGQLNRCYAFIKSSGASFQWKEV
jgi:uncharacterized protein YdiU (UPF0061 family)